MKSLFMSTQGNIYISIMKGQDNNIILKISLKTVYKYQ